MEMFVSWEAPISMRVEWKCASMIPGEQCVMTTGTALMLLSCVNSWDMEVSICINLLLKSFTCYPVYTDGRAYSYAHFGAGSGPIFLDDVHCRSRSSQLLECPSRPILIHDCTHLADAGVGCEGELHIVVLSFLFHNLLP